VSWEFCGSCETCGSWMSCNFCGIWGSLDLYHHIYPIYFSFFLGTTGSYVSCGFCESCRSFQFTPYSKVCIHSIHKM
jgi:hypothetical protein